MQAQTGRERTSFPRAVSLVLRHLQAHHEPHTVATLAEESGLHRRTVEKVVDTLLTAQHFLEVAEIKAERLRRLRLIQAVERGGILGIPPQVQRLIIKTAFYPTPNREQEVLVHLLLHKAIRSEQALTLPPSTILGQLRAAGYVAETTRGWYLTGDGQTIAQGALALYPELAEVALP